MKGLAGKSVLVTGAGSGIGQAAACLFAEAGCSVTVVDVRAEPAAATVELIKSAGGTAHFVRADVSDENEVREMVTSAVQKYGRLDGAANVAGVPQRGVVLHEISLADWDRVHNVNLRGMFLCFKYQIMAMLTSGGGSIVAVGSISGVKGIRNSADYNSSKAGLGGLVRGAAIDYSAKNIRVNLLNPGGTRTPMSEQSLRDDPRIADAIAAIPVKRLAEPREIAAGIVFLISDAASYVTGSVYNVDGGLAIA
jgi:2,5-dichloro-2,5-cyclohexadiene-1,4-diol dehydrogenase 1